MTPAVEDNAGPGAGSGETMTNGEPTFRRRGPGGSDHCEGLYRSRGGMVLTSVGPSACPVPVDPIRGGAILATGAPATWGVSGGCRRRTVSRAASRHLDGGVAQQGDTSEPRAPPLAPGTRSVPTASVLSNATSVMTHCDASATCTRSPFS